MAAVHIVIVAARSGTLSEEGAHMLNRRERLHRAALDRGRHGGQRFDSRIWTEQKRGVCKAWKAADVGVLNTMLNQVEYSSTRKIMGQSALSVELAAKSCDEQRPLCDRTQHGLGRR